MLTQTTERHGLKKLPGIDWGCLMRRYTETVTGLGGQWINLATARVREDIVSSNSVGVLEDARTALQLLQILLDHFLNQSPHLILKIESKKNYKFPKLCCHHHLSLK